MVTMSKPQNTGRRAINNNGSRDYGLDFLRAAAMLLGVWFHAQLIYIDPAMVLGEESPLLPSVPEASLITFTGFVWVHLWRMPVFFLLAGFFAHLVITRKGRRYFLTDRIIRILIPLIVFLWVYAYLFEQSSSTLVHLWFLYYLTLFYAIFIIVHIVAMNSFIKNNILPAITKVENQIFRTPQSLCVLIIPMICLTFFAREQGLWSKIPATLFDRQPAAFVSFLTFFTIGCFLSKHRDLLRQLSTKRILTRFLGLGSIFFVLTLAVWGSLHIMPILLDLRHDILVSMLSGTALFFWCFGLPGLCSAVITEKARWLSFLIEISYPTYVFHLAIVVAWSIFFVENGIEQHLAVMMNFILSLGLCMILYLLLVRYTPLSWIFRGYHKSKLKLEFKNIL